MSKKYFLLFENVYFDEWRVSQRARGGFRLPRPKLNKKQLK